MNEETTKLLKSMLTFLESRKSAINVVVEYNRSIGNKDEEMFTMGRMAEIDVVISELKNDLGIPIEVIDDGIPT